MIAEALAVAGSPAMLARIAGPIGEAARAAAARLDHLAPADRRRRRAEWAAIARAPVPPGARGIHATWIEAALAALPPRARASVAAGGGDAVDVWLARWVTATFPGGVADTVPDPATWLARVGAEQLAFALAGAGPGPLAAAVQRLGAPLVRALEDIKRPPRLGNLGTPRAAIERCRGLALDDPHAFARLAARAIAPHFDPLARLALVHRLPRELGIVVDREMREHAATPLDRVPTRLALGLQHRAA